MQIHDSIATLGDLAEATRGGNRSGSEDKRYVYSA